MICPICGASDHKVYNFKGTPILACPKAPEDKILSFPDENLCGLEPFTTGKWDPFFESKACVRHDMNQTERKAAISTAARFAYDAMNTAVINTAKAVYSVAFVIPYIAIGGIGGYVRDIFRRK